MLVLPLRQQSQTLDVVNVVVDGFNVGSGVQVPRSETIFNAVSVINACRSSIMALPDRFVHGSAVQNVSRHAKTMSPEPVARQLEFQLSRFH